MNVRRADAPLTEEGRNLRNSYKSSLTNCKVPSYVTCLDLFISEMTNVRVLYIFGYLALNQSVNLHL